MFRSTKHFAWAIAGALITLTAGSPALADDVELLLHAPGASNAAKPNILFIIDSSGSMTTVEESHEPYDGSVTYSGDCDGALFYWTEGSDVPDCDDAYAFQKQVFVCAQGLAQIAAAGSYSDTMAMYRGGKWQNFRDGMDDKLVECAADSGVHGAGANPGVLPYAQSGKKKPQYTAVPGLSVDWGSSPTEMVYTVYDPNFLNWYHNPPGSSLSRTDIVKAVTKNVLGAINNVNVGFMRFNYEQGGPVIHALKDLDTHRSEANAVVDGIPASGWTPLSETMYEAALYYSGLPAYYGGIDDTDPAALHTSSPMVYEQPVDYACTKNFIVLLTDGKPTRDIDAFTRVPTLPDFQPLMGRDSCTGGNQDGACLDDVAEYLSKVDINPVVPGKQSVTTHTIGFTIDLPILKQTAENSGGEYHLASDVKTLTAALTEILTDIFDRDISFTAPAVAVNAFNRTQHLNDLYVSVFRAADEVHWPGNLKKFTIKESAIRDANDNDAVDPATGYFSDQAKNFWSQQTAPDGADVTIGGAANVLPDPSQRRLYTNKATGLLTLPVNSLTAANAGLYLESEFGLTGSAGEPTKESLIDWARGVDVKDEDNDPDTTVRYAMGDTLHSEPAAVVYGNASGTQDIVVFNATNDGYLHAIDANTGQELWSFVPHELLENFRDLYVNQNVGYKNYGIDGNIVPVVYDKDGDGIIEPADDFVYLVFGMRRGGYRYYMLDVSDRNSPSLRWTKTYPDFGQTWSTPSVARIDVASAAQTSAQKAVLVLGGGYDTAHDSPTHPSGPDGEGAGIYMLDLETGNQIWRAGRDEFADLVLPGMTRSIPSMIRVVDMNGDGFADRMYTADLGGQLWRLDIRNGKAPVDLVAGGIIAQLGAEGLPSPTAADTRRFYTTPDVALFTDKRLDRRYLAINVGSGYRAHPLDDSAADRFYSIRDKDVFASLPQSDYDTYDIVEDGDLIDVAGQTGTVIPANGRGWKLSLPGGQMVLSSARTFDDTVYFVTFEADADSPDPCQAGLSKNRLYRVNVVNGDPIVPLGAAVHTGGNGPTDARVTELAQSGIAPRPVFLFPSPWDPDCEGEKCAPPPVTCIGVECFDPGFRNNPVRTLWTQDGEE